MRNSLTCLSLLAALCLPAPAIDPNRSMSQYVRDLWTVDRGFPKGPVYSIHQTRDGYLWIGIEKGLVQFDGLQFEMKAMSGQMEYGPLSHVLQLVADAQDTLWIRPRRPSLLLYRKGAFEDGLARSPLANRTITAMAPARDGGLLLWILRGEPSAVVRRPNGSFETLAEPVGFSRSPVLAIAEGSGGEVWVGTRDAGLFRLRGKQTIAVTEGLPDPKVNAIAAGPNGEFWIGTDSGVVRWNGSRLTREGVPASIQKVQALALTIDRDANLWVGTNSDGLLRVNSHGVSSLAGTADWSGEAVTTVFEDREGNIWAGSGRGLERFRDSAFVTYSAAEGVPGDGSNPVLADAGQRIWFAPANGGLMWFEDGQQARAVAGVRDFVYSIAQGPGGEIWAGTQLGGLLRLRNSALAESMTVAHGLAQESVYAVYPAHDGSVWAGTLSGGLSRYQNGKLTTYTVADGLLSNTIQAIAETRDGATWIGTPNGLNRLEPGGRWQSFRKRVGLPSEDVACLLEDSTGQLWVGTTAGIALRQSETRFGVPPSLLESLREPILGIAEDRLESFWIATSARVMRVHRQRLLRGHAARRRPSRVRDRRRIARRRGCQAISLRGDRRVGTHLVFVEPWDFGGGSGAAAQQFRAGHRAGAVGDGRWQGAGCSRGRRDASSATFGPAHRVWIRGAQSFRAGESSTPVSDGRLRPSMERSDGGTRNRVHEPGRWTLPVPRDGE